VQTKKRVVGDFDGEIPVFRPAVAIAPGGIRGTDNSCFDAGRKKALLSVEFFDEALLGIDGARGKGGTGMERHGVVDIRFKQRILPRHPDFSQYGKLLEGKGLDTSRGGIDTDGRECGELLQVAQVSHDIPG